MTVHDVNRLLARTINVCPDLGAAAEAGYTVELTAREFDLFRQAGFSAVRLGVYWAAHCGAGPDFRIAPEILDRVRGYLDLATERGMAVVLTNFLDRELIADPPSYLARLLAITGQVAAACADRPSSVVLEPYAEPHDALDPLWNDTLRDLLVAVRAADPGRAVVVGPGSYNNARMLPQLSLPTDPHLIVTVHQYWPITFTMQGETWLGTATPGGDPRSWLGTAWTGTDRERAELAAGYAGVAAWAAAGDHPIFVGEFGTSNNADLDSRARWTGYNRQLAEEHGFSWGCWSFGPTFALYDFGTHRWHEPLLRALMP
ncbi:glycoside hydrolase family 5 protein [Nocardia sp. alder85J]|uniref:glycoside hydrolase family 5 protein n=1 Tax=Nocardia sp. alder85J TaxID=2862949 RepID=UPI001CD5703F|nr:cellulase family glycosylhydrolase [Nocardia sp. alder85J]MCX4099063.1 cellulase family glycosylhydrolase [Nocardia sp. alder85J]